MGTIKQEEELTRIADALESINSNLSDVAEKLEDIERHLDCCIAYSGDRAFFRIAGSVSTN